MQLRTKTALILFITTIVLVGSLYTISNTILLAGYQRVEQQEVTQSVLGLKGSLLDDYTTLYSDLGDWSLWDDAYAFVQNNNSAFAQTNLIAPQFLCNSFCLNYILFFNSSGTYVNGMGFNLTTSSVMSVPHSLLTTITGNPLFWNFQNANDSVVGIILTQNGPLELASRPILTTAGNGPIHGALIFGRYVDQQFVESLSVAVNAPVSLTLFSNETDFNGTASYTSTLHSIYVHPLNATTIIGYYVVDDVYGKPAIVLGETLPRSTYEQGLLTLGYADLAVAAACISFSIAMLVLLDRLVVSRLYRLDKEVRAIRLKDDAPARLPVSGDDAISSLRVSINDMLGKIENTSRQLRKSERFAGIGELATMVAHDLRNPLQGIANATYYLKRNPAMGPKEKEMLALIEEDVRYSDKIVGDLLDYSKETSLDLEETSPRLVMDKALSMIAPHPNINIVDETTDTPKLKLDVDRMTRVFINIINNAIDAMPSGGLLRLQSRDANHGVQFIFADNGVGMKKEVLEKIFTPLFTTKPKGMGFGLSICKRIVEAHGGQISVESTPNEGTTFVIWIPLDVKPAGGDAS
jgi:signal transduction histidine kinase